MIAPLALQVTDQLVEIFGEDVRVLELPAHADERGRLVELDFSLVPFEVRRAFTVAGARAGTIRGGHRHRAVEHLLSCVAGSVEVELRRGNASAVITLEPDSGHSLYLAAGVWSSQRYLEVGSTLLVLASEPFDPAGYDSGY